MYNSTCQLVCAKKKPQQVHVSWRKIILASAYYLSRSMCTCTPRDRIYQTSEPIRCALTSQLCKWKMLQMTLWLVGFSCWGAHLWSRGSHLACYSKVGKTHLGAHLFFGGLSQTKRLKYQKRSTLLVFGLVCRLSSLCSFGCHDHKVVLIVKVWTPKNSSATYDLLPNNR